MSVRLERSNRGNREKDNRRLSNEDVAQSSPDVSSIDASLSASGGLELYENLGIVGEGTYG